MNRVKFADVGRASFFNDGRWRTAQMVIMHELDFDFRVFSQSQFEKLLGFKKSKRRYLCFDCVESAQTKVSELDVEQWKTASLVTENILICAMCGQNHNVLRKGCKNTDCKGSVVSSSFGVETCHTCYQEQISP